MRMLERWRSRLRSDPLLRHSALLWIAAQAGNAANLLFQWTMFRGLAAAEYGALMALTGATLALSLPLDALRAAVSRQVARAGVAGIGPTVVRRMLRRWALAMAAVACALMALAALGTAPLTRAWSLSDPALVPLAIAAFSAALFLPLASGALQGFQRFGWLAALGPVFGGTRLALSAALVFGVAATARAALAGHAAGLALAALVGGIGVRFALSRATGRDDAGPDAGSGAAGDFLRALPALLAFGVLMNADVPLAKQGLTPELAGAFARAATIARMIVFLPMPVAMAVYPKIVARAENVTERRRLERRSALFAGVLSLAAALGVVVLADPLWRFFSGGAAAADEVRTVRLMAIAMAPLGGVYLQLNLLLARGRWKAGWALVPLALGYVAVALGLPVTPARVALALGVSAWLAWPALAWAGRR